MIIKRIPAGIYAANCFLLMDDPTKNAAIIDPGGDGDDIIKEIEKLGAKPQYILLTHGHFDHVGAVDELRGKYNIPVYINKNDEELINSGVEVFGKIGSPNNPLSDNMVISLGELKIRCIETPGHTPGGMCFLIQDALFTGDTLFAGSIGRTDFVGGDFNSIIKSIKSKLLVLKDDVKVYPGHGLTTTIGVERVSNPFL
jgi:hydroxyacylglutathione hydrolase